MNYAVSHTPPAGQRWVTVLRRVKKVTRSGPYMRLSPNAERFQMQKLWYATGTGDVGHTDLDVIADSPLADRPRALISGYSSAINK